MGASKGLPLANTSAKLRRSAVFCPQAKKRVMRRSKPKNVREIRDILVLLPVIFSHKFIISSPVQAFGPTTGKVLLLVAGTSKARIANLAISWVFM